MFTLKNHIMVESLDDAYELAQERGNIILGGNLWLKMGNRKFENAIDLSNLGLESIEESEDSFIIGAMTSLRDLELHQGLNDYFGGYFAKAVEGIVGVQFRNGATVGGSVASKLGFSNIITALLALDSYVEFAHEGVIALSDFLTMKALKDVLVRIIIKKDGRKVACDAVQKSATDFPILASAVSYGDGTWTAVLGGRPGAAKKIVFTADANLSENDIEALLEKVKNDIPLGSNYLGSQEYRVMLAKVLTKRNLMKISGGNHGN